MKIIFVGKANALQSEDLLFCWPKEWEGMWERVRDWPLSLEEPICTLAEYNMPSIIIEVDDMINIEPPGVWGRSSSSYETDLNVCDSIIFNVPSFGYMNEMEQLWR